jgi:hypothetical protein
MIQLAAMTRLAVVLTLMGGPILRLRSAALVVRVTGRSECGSALDAVRGIAEQPPVEVLGFDGLSVSEIGSCSAGPGLTSDSLISVFP